MKTIEFPKKREPNNEETTAFFRDAHAFYDFLGAKWLESRPNTNIQIDQTSRTISLSGKSVFYPFKQETALVFQINEYTYISEAHAGFMSAHIQGGPPEKKIEQSIYDTVVRAARMIGAWGEIGAIHRPTELPKNIEPNEWRDASSGVWIGMDARGPLFSPFGVLEIRCQSRYANPQDPQKVYARWISPELVRFLTTTYPRAIYTINARTF